MVTITGVVCGIAFLVSIMTSQLIKKGLSEEDSRRDTATRITQKISMELPALKGRIVAVMGSGGVDEIEMRVLENIAERGPAAILLPRAKSPRLLRPLKTAREASEDEIDGATVIFIMGREAPPLFDWEGFLKGSLNAMLAISSTEEGAFEFVEALGTVPAECLVFLRQEADSEELERRQNERGKERFRSYWIISISLLVTVIGIANAMLMSVTERFREIGTMKCLGALSSFVTRIFVLEASIVGFVGGVAGALLGILFSLIAYMLTYGTALVMGSLRLVPLVLYILLGIVSGVVLSVFAAVYPAKVAAAMVPATALRSTV